MRGDREVDKWFAQMSSFEFWTGIISVKRCPSGGIANPAGHDAPNLIQRIKTARAVPPVTFFCPWVDIKIVSGFITYMPHSAAPHSSETLFPGVTRLRFGTPEKLTPVSLRTVSPAAESLDRLAPPPDCPVDLSAIHATTNARGCRLEIPLELDEELYGFGLQLKSHRQRERGKPGKKKLLRVNSDPVADTGDSHAPVPFYVSTRGYGILVDTARYATFYCGCAHSPVPPRRPKSSGASAAQTVESAEELYADIGDVFKGGGSSHVHVEVPIAAGVDIYVFWGADLREAVQRYNLFSGGGCLPTRWGLGNWYRVRTTYAQSDVMPLAQRLRDQQMPCDVLGLEPGWQSQKYPCTFVWSEEFPDPQTLHAELGALGYRTNLWTHIFTHPESPIYQNLLSHSGTHTGFGGIVPDLSIPEAREIFAKHHETHHVDIGASGYKLDECDNSDFISYPWSFPEITEFPSGLDGEQMHSLVGRLYQETLHEVFERRNQRTYGLVRSAHALAAPQPYVLYSDLYDHADFIRGTVNIGFTGLLWTPELRHAVNPEDLVRRLQSAVCSPQALINGWYIQNPPWEQWNTQLNNQGILAENRAEVETLCRQVLEFRMQLIPYLYHAFARYWSEGLPPFRALAMDYPQDPIAGTIDNQYFMGDHLLVAPMIAGQTSRPVYLPEGRWHDFETGELYEGGQTVEFAAPLGKIPIFVKSGALIPLAQPTQHVGEPGAKKISVHVYGNGSLGGSLFEDDGETFDYQKGAFNWLELRWDGAKIDAKSSAPRGSFQYEILGGKSIG